MDQNFDCCQHQQMMYLPVFAIYDEDLMDRDFDPVKCVRFVERDYAESERSLVVLAGPKDGLGVLSKRKRVHTSSEIRKLVRLRLRHIASHGRQRTLR